MEGDPRPDHLHQAAGKERVILETTIYNLGSKHPQVFFCHHEQLSTLSKNLLLFDISNESNSKK